MSDNKNYPSTDYDSVISVGITIVLIVFVIFGGWSAFAPLATYSIASGKVSAGYDKRVIRSKSGGEIKEIFVQDGDFVKKGTLLLQLDDEKIKKEIKIKETQFLKLSIIESTLLAKINQDENITFPPLVLAQKNRIEVSSLIEQKRELFKREREKINNENSITNQIISQLEAQISNLKAKNGNEEEIAKLNIQLAQIKEQKVLKEKEYLDRLNSELFRVQTKLTDLKNQFVILVDKLKETTIKAPIDGNIVNMKFHSVGEVIPTSKIILEIIPKNPHFIIEARVQPTDIDTVKEGLKTDLIFPAFNTRMANVVEGEVFYVSDDTYSDSKGYPFYFAKIRVTNRGEKELKEYGFKLVAGMPAQAMIRTGSRTLLNYFLKPFIDMFQHAFNEE